MPPLTLRKRKPKIPVAPSPKPASDAVTPVRPKPKPKSKKAPADGEASVAQVLAPQPPRDNENVTFKLRIAAETLASLKHTIPNPEPQELEDTSNLDICYGEIPWNTGVEDKEETEEDVDELIDELSENGLEDSEDGAITIFCPSP